MTDPSASSTAAFAAQLDALPARSRVHEVAKRFGVASRTLLEALSAAGGTLTSSSASVDAATARTALTALHDSGRLVVVVPTNTADTAAPAGDVDTTIDAAAAATPEAAPAAATPTPVEPAPWAPLFAEPDVTAAPAKPARRRASRPAAPPAPVETAPVETAPVDTAAQAPVAAAAAPSDDELYADLPTRMRVHELAKRAGISAKTLIAALTEQGVAAKSPNSVIARDVAVQLLRSLAEPADADDAADLATAATEAPDQESAVADEDREDGGRGRRRRGRRGRNRGADRDAESEDSSTDDETGTGSVTDETDTGADETASDEAGADDTDGADEADGAGDRGASRGRRRRRRGGRGGERATDDETTDSRPDGGADSGDGADETEDDGDAEGESEGGTTGSARRRRRRRRGGSDDAGRPDDPADTVVHVRETRSAESEVQGVRGSTRLEAKRQRRRDSLQTRRRPQILTEAEFLARRESVHRVMAVRQRHDLTQVAVLEDNVLVEHFVSRAGSASMIGNVHLGRVQNVLPSMEAAFVDIGKGRNAVLYAGEVNWQAAGLAGKSRRIESALSSGDTVLVQVSKDPVGHKGARLTTQISLPGRFLVYVPAGGATGISRKLPDTERKRLKAILDRIVPDDAGVIIRTAAEGVSEEELARDVERLKAQWEQIQAAAAQQTQGAQPKQLYSEPDTLIKVIRDLFNSDISELIIDGDDSDHGIWDSLSSYVHAVAPELEPRLHRYDGPTDVFAAHRIDEQIAKALERKVYLPSGGSLVIDRTEAMTVVDVNTGKYTGSGGNLEETVTKNNLEAAEEVVRQLRLRDIGGIIVVDFIDMVLESNRELVLRRLTECLGRDRTRHQVAEVTSLGLVQMTRKKMGTGLVEAFSEPCAHCHGRGIVLRDVPVDPTAVESAEPAADRTQGRRNRGGRGREAVVEVEPVVPVVATPRRDPRGPKPPESGSGSSRPAEDAPVDELSSSLLAELNGRAVEPTAVAADPADTATPVDPDALAALLPPPVAGGSDDTDQDGPDGRDDDQDTTAPRRRRRGGRGRNRRDRGEQVAGDASGPDGDADEGVSPDDAVLGELDEPSTVDSGSAEVEADQLDLLPASEVETAAPEILDPADAMSDTSLMEPVTDGGSDPDVDGSDADPDDAELPDSTGPVAGDAETSVTDPDVADTAAHLDVAAPSAVTSDDDAPATPAAAKPRRRRSASRPAGPPAV